jgi:hypothetical protein
MCSYFCGATLWLILFICGIHAASGTNILPVRVAVRGYG